MREYTELVGSNKTIKSEIPLAMSGKTYILKDVRITDIHSDSTRHKTAHRVSIRIDNQVVLSRVIGSTHDGEIASVDLNQEVQSTSRISITTELTDGLTIDPDFLYTAVTLSYSEKA
jgi:hypothetical protein